ncbi:antifreeze glycopeptide [Thalassospira marina]|uniref:Antifreeze glycopeptide n=1 Tax=Thalassospira marina TaxID=2048283 RepID=A0A2N3KD98_9PROT|nr:antifreeze glycopeptide [Thalassospira marina]PKR48521.1 antifreeze glycopeptide [Thalassospira marina]
MRSGTTRACLVACLTGLGTLMQVIPAGAQQGPVPLFLQNRNNDTSTATDGNGANSNDANQQGLGGGASNGAGSQNIPQGPNGVFGWGGGAASNGNENYPTNPDAVQTLELNAVDAESVGILDRNSGGLGVDMWSGTTRDTAARLIDALPDQPGSRAIRNLERRLLLSIAAAPADHKDISLLSHRVAKLQSMGAYGDVAKLINATAHNKPSADLAEAQVNALLVTGQLDEACSAIEGYGTQFDTPFWLKAAVYCQLRAKNTSSATFTTDLIREVEGESDKLFFALNKAIRTGSNVSPDLLVNLRPLDVAMLELTKQGLPAGKLQNADAPTLIAFVKSANTASDLKLEAARLAEQRGFITIDDLASAYMAVTFTSDELANVLDDASEETPAREYAKLYQAAAKSEVPAARAEILAHIYENARSNGDYGQIARLCAPLLEDIPINNDFAWFAADALAAAIYSNDLERAGGWLAQAKSSANNGNSIESRLIVLYPALVLAGLEDTGAADNERSAATGIAPVATFGLGGANTTGTQAPATSQAQARHRARMDEWAELQTARNDQVEARDDAELVYSLFAAFGVEVPEKFWDSLLTQPYVVSSAVPNAGVVHKLAQAAATGQRAMAASLVAISNGTLDSDMRNAVSLGQAVGALRAVGLENDARRIAVETILESGL